MTKKRIQQRKLFSKHFEKKFEVDFFIGGRGCKKIMSKKMFKSKIALTSNFGLTSKFCLTSKHCLMSKNVWRGVFYKWSKSVPEMSHVKPFVILGDTLVTFEKKVSRSQKCQKWNTTEVQIISLPTRAYNSSSTWILHPGSWTTSTSTSTSMTSSTWALGGLIIWLQEEACNLGGLTIEGAF